MLLYFFFPEPESTNLENVPAEPSLPCIGDEGREMNKVKAWFKLDRAWGLFDRIGCVYHVTGSIRLICQV